MRASTMESGYTLPITKKASTKCQFVSLSEFKYKSNLILLSRLSMSNSAL